MNLLNINSNPSQGLSGDLFRKFNFIERILISLGLVITSWFFVIAMGSYASAATYNVTTATPTGAGSLEQAIIDANTNPGADTITFAIPGSGPYSIIRTDGQGFTPVTDPVTIDGTSQMVGACDGTTFRPQINIGTDSSNYGAALQFNNGSDGSIVQGVVVSNTRINGNGAVLVMPGADDFVFRCSFIGVESDGTTPFSTQGIRIYAEGAVIGGSSVADRNIIGNCDLSGGRCIQMGDCTVAGLGAQGSGTIQNNYIGTDVSGSVGIHASGFGVSIGCADNILIRDNVVSGTAGGASGAGIYLFGSATDYAQNNEIYNNKIGTDPSGITAVPNTGSGLWLNGFSKGTKIGSSSVSDRNIISGNGIHGITLTYDNVPGFVTGNIIQNNYIGVDSTGISALGNGQNGVLSAFANQDQFINNTISGNTNHAFQIQDTSNNIYYGNSIGTDAATHSLDLGNGTSGLVINSSSHNNHIGGLGVGEANFIMNNGKLPDTGYGWGNGILIGSPTLNDSSSDNEVIGNVIANNGANGIQVSSGDDNTKENTFLQNTMYGNSALAISLDSDTPLANDSGDGDGWANERINYPTVRHLQVSGSNTIVTYQVNLQPGDYRFDFCANPSGQDPSLHGECEEWIASENRAGVAGGDQYYTMTVPGTSFDVTKVSMMTTVLDGSANGYGSSSELGSYLSTESDLRINIVDTPSPYAQPGSTVTYGVRVANNGTGSVDSFVVDINQTNCTTTNVVVVNGSSTATTPGTYDSLTGLWQGALDMNQELYLQVTCTTTGSVGQNIDIAADVDTGTVINPSVPNVDPDMANNTATASVPISAISDDSIVGTLQTTGPILNGTNFIVRQTISNLGAGPSSAAGGLSVIFVLPPNVSFNSVTDINISDNYDLVGCSVIPGASSTQGYPDSSDAVMCTVTSTTNELSPGDSFSIDFNLQANADLIPGVSRFDSFIVDFGGSSTDPDSGVVSNGLGTGTGYSLTNPPVNNNVSVVTYTLDPLTATITPCAGQANPTTINDACFTLQFNKPINESTLELSDLVSSNGTIYSLIKLDSTTWELRVKDMNPGAVTVNIATGTVTDLEIMALSNNPSSSIIYQLPPSSEPQQNTTNSNTNTDPSLSSTGHTIYRAMIIAGVVIVGGVGIFAARKFKSRQH